MRMGRSRHCSAADRFRQPEFVSPLVVHMSRFASVVSPFAIILSSSYGSLIWSSASKKSVYIAHGNYQVNCYRSAEGGCLSPRVCCGWDEWNRQGRPTSRLGLIWHVGLPLTVTFMAPIPSTAVAFGKCMLESSMEKANRCIQDRSNP
ncbi:hypothetical protein Ac2012v2_002257 [Leucoagaricus gongylophorus]